MKDWTGNSKSVFTALGASNHTDKDRQSEDFYATDPIAAELLCDVVRFDGPIWEPACGMGHLAEVFRKRGYNVKASDLINRGYGDVQDFLGMDVADWDGDIITNPPYKYIYRALSIVPDGRKVAMFLKIQFLEGKARRELFDKFPPKTVYVSSSRILCAKNAEFEKMIAGGGSAVAYAWFVWEKGYSGETVIKWIN